MATSAMGTIDSPVLVLNQNYQPLNICSARRALILMGRGKAESIIDGAGEVRSVADIFPLPSVVRLFYMVKKPLVKRKLSRQALFYRDNFTCQYCGKGTKKLTIDTFSLGAKVENTYGRMWSVHAADATIKKLV